MSPATDAITLALFIVACWIGAALVLAGAWIGLCELADWRGRRRAARREAMRLPRATAPLELIELDVSWGWPERP